MLALGVAGCQSVTGNTGPVTAKEEAALLKAPIRDGETTREEVLLAFGLPSASFEGDRILAYRLASTQTGVMVLTREVDPFDVRVSAWHIAHYNLIVVFDAQGVVERHVVLRIR